jgi:hypothetical protein
MKPGHDDGPIEIVIEGEGTLWLPAMDALKVGDPKPLANLMRLEPAPAWVCKQLAIMLDPPKEYIGRKLLIKPLDGRQVLEKRMKKLREYREYRKLIISEINKYLKADGKVGYSEKDLPEGYLDRAIKFLEDPAELGVSERTLYKAWKYDDSEFVLEGLHLLGLIPNSDKS